VVDMAKALLLCGCTCACLSNRPNHRNKDLRSDYAAERVQAGVFGAMMDVQLRNDGPVTLVLDSKDKDWSNSAGKTDDTSTAGGKANAQAQASRTKAVKQHPVRPASPNTSQSPLDVGSNPVATQTDPRKPSDKVTCEASAHAAGSGDAAGL